MKNEFYNSENTFYDFNSSSNAEQKRIGAKKLTHQYTMNNHFKFGYSESGWFVNPDGTENERWLCEYGSCKIRPSNLVDECEYAAKYILDTNDEAPNIMLSGGAESEIVLRSFLAIGAKSNIKVSIMQYEDNLNIHDISFGIAFCEQHGVKYDIFKLDLEHFLYDGVGVEYADRTLCCTPQLLPAMWLADQLDGLPILGSGEPYIKRDDMEDPDSTWTFQEKERIQSWYRHFLIQDRPAIPGFFQYTPGIMYMFLTHPEINTLVRNEDERKQSSVYTKSNVYRAYWTDMAYRKKASGFEHHRATEASDRLREYLENRFPHYDRAYEIEYNKFLGRLCNIV